MMKLKLIMQKFFVGVFIKSIEDEQHKKSRLRLQDKFCFLAVQDSHIAAEMHIYEKLNK